VLLTVRSQYRYQAVSKIFQRSQMPTKIYILSCANISFEINTSLIKTTVPLPQWITNSAPGGKCAPYFGNWKKCKLTEITVLTFEVLRATGMSTGVFRFVMSCCFIRWLPMFRLNILLPSSRHKAEDDNFPRNIINHLPDCAASQVRWDRNRSKIFYYLFIYQCFH
jgi:hypothetical protein